MSIFTSLFKLQFESTMNREEIFDKLFLLAPSSYIEDDFRDHLSNSFTIYKNYLNQIDDSTKAENWDDIIFTINKICRDILNIINKAYKGLHSDAYNQLKKCLNYLQKTIDFYVYFKEGSYFYRLRVFNDFSGEIPVAKDLFHIPFSKRGLVKTERYSTPGLPCFYLGISSYVCWEELRRPPLHLCYFSKVHLNKEIKLLNLSLPTKDFLQDEAYFCHYLLKFPFILACMTKVKNPKDTFKPEYILPQLITEWIIEKQQRKGNNAIGVYYSSIFSMDGFKFPDFIFHNIAIPALQSSKEEYSKMLCELFKITDPTNEEINRVKGTIYPIIKQSPCVNLSSDRNGIFMPNYINSIFSKIDNI